jgi:hypothetical protein
MHVLNPVELATLYALPGHVFGIQKKLFIWVNNFSIASDDHICNASVLLR